MKKATCLLALLFLFAVWPVQGQTPTTAAEYVTRGNERNKTGDYDGAIADFGKALELNPKDPEPYYNRGIVRAAKGDYDGAIADYSQYIQLNPANPQYLADGYNNRGIARRARGDVDGAISDYNKAMELHPGDAFHYENRGNARSDKGDIAGAIADYNKALELAPNKVSVYYNRGIVRAKKADYAGAIADYDKAIEIDSSYLEAYYNRGISRKARGDLAGAVADYEKYVLLNPSNPRYLADGYNNLARLLATAPYDALRDGKKAVRYATKAAELTNWQDAKVLDTLAAAYAEAGNFDDAIKWENKALTFPDFAKSFGAVGGQRLQLYADKKPYREK